MEAEELMISDKLKTVFSQKIVKVKEIKQSCIYTEDNSYEYDEIEPIPLTSEVFEKNGFIFKEGEKGIFGVTIAPYYMRDDFPFKVFCDGEPFAIWFEEPVNIKYFHQLQHVMRLCGIKKEIIL